MAEEKKTKAAFSIATDTVKHVAYLVRLGIKEEEARAFSGQFTAIIDYFHLLNEVDTNDVPPATEIAATRSVMREDEVRPSMSREEFLNNVPHKDGAFVQVPLVFDDD